MSSSHLSRLFDVIRSHLPAGGRGASLVRALAGSMGLRLLGMGLGFLVGVQLARGLGPSGYGIYGIAMSIVSLLLIPLEFGVPQLVTREVAATAREGVASSAILAWSSRLVLVNSLVLATISVPVVLWSGAVEDPSLKNALLLGLLMLPTIAASNILSAALRGMQRIIEGQVAELVIRPALISVLLLCLSVWHGGAYLGAPIAMALNALAAFIGSAYAYFRLAPALATMVRTNPGPELRSAWLRSALPLAMGDGMRIVSGQLGILVLGAFAAIDEVGIYRVAFGIYVVATLPSALLNATCSPMLARLHAEGRVDAIQRLNGWMTLFLILSAAACILPFALGGEAIVSIVFGAEYAPAVPVLMTLLLGELAAGLLGHPTIVLNMLRHERAVTWFSFLAMMLNLALCWALTPSLGGMGAALGVAVSQFAWRLAASGYAHQHLSLHTSVLAWFKLRGT